MAWGSGLLPYEQTSAVSNVHTPRTLAYTAVLGSVDEFAAALWAWAWHRGVPSTADSSVTADGVEWIWRLVVDLFPDNVQIVDWYHAC